MLSQRRPSFADAVRALTSVHPSLPSPRRKRAAPAETPSMNGLKDCCHRLACRSRDRCRNALTSPGCWLKSLRRGIAAPEPDWASTAETRKVAASGSTALLPSGPNTPQFGCSSTARAAGNGGVMCWRQGIYRGFESGESRRGAHDQVQCRLSVPERHAGEHKAQDACSFCRKAWERRPNSCATACQLQNRSPVSRQQAAGGSLQ